MLQGERAPNDESVPECRAAEYGAKPYQRCEAGRGTGGLSGRSAPPP